MPDARVDRAARTTVNLQSLAEPIRVHPAGSDALVVAVLGPGVYLVEVMVPDDQLASGAWYETLELAEGEFELVEGPDVA
jgi:hypothetical protein